MTILGNVRAVAKQLACRHHRFDTVYLPTSNPFGIPRRGGRSRTLELNICLHCGRVRAMSITSSLAATPDGTGREANDDKA